MKLKDWVDMLAEYGPAIYDVALTSYEKQVAVGLCYSCKLSILNAEFNAAHRQRQVEYAKQQAAVSVEHDIELAVIYARWMALEFNHSMWDMLRWGCDRRTGDKLRPLDRTYQDAQDRLGVECGAKRRTIDIEYKTRFAAINPVQDRPRLTLQRSRT